MDEFFRAVRGQFAEQRSYEGRAGLIVALAFALLLLVWLGSQLLRIWRARAALRQFAARHSIAAPELSLVAALARGAKRSTLEVLEQLDLFELLTGKALASPGGAEFAGRIGNLRRALGYDRVPDYMPLYTSRELPPGAAVVIGNEKGQTVESTELGLTVQLDKAIEQQIGDVLALEVPQAREATYRLHCRLLEIAATASGKARLVFAHDKSPMHLLSVEARRPARGAIILRPAFAAGELQPPEQPGELLEAGTHDLLITSHLPLVPGHQVDCSFHLGPEAFQMRALIQAADGAPASGAYSARLHFMGISELERKRLRKAILLQQQTR